MLIEIGRGDIASNEDVSEPSIIFDTEDILYARRAEKGGSLIVTHGAGFVNALYSVRIVRGECSMEIPLNEQGYNKVIKAWQQEEEKRKESKYKSIKEYKRDQ